jgi:hypothetical protein
MMLPTLALVAAACSGSDPEAPSSTTTSTTTPATATTIAAAVGEGRAIPPTNAVARNHLGFEFPPPPAVPDGPLAPEVDEAVNTFFSSLSVGVDLEALRRVGDGADARVAWLVADLLRFVASGDAQDTAVAAFERLTGVTLSDDPVSFRSPWQSVTDHLIAWDLPAPPRYRELKGSLFRIIDERWAPFFDDPEATIDYRLLSWGGVRIDDRPLGDPFPCVLGCIPALDDPAVTPASDGDWYPDDGIVFAVALGGEARAYPKNMMEVHEMVNDTLGGRRIGLPYCTLCGSAQVYYTDSVPSGVEIPVLRTSGLLSRSNKVMYDLNTFSVFDTFTGVAVSGPLREQGIELEQGIVITTTWGEWKAEYPGTTILARDGGIGRVYDLDPLRGRDAGGPIFPIGGVDERLPVQSQVLGVESPDGGFVAFPVDEALAALRAGGTVELRGITVVEDGGGLRAELPDGTAITSHQSFWFAWSQFHPDTVVWAPPPGG